MKEFHQIIKDYFNGRFETNKPVYYEESTFLPIFTIKDNLDNLIYSLFKFFKRNIKRNNCP